MRESEANERNGVPGFVARGVMPLRRVRSARARETASVMKVRIEEPEWAGELRK